MYTVLFSPICMGLAVTALVLYIMTRARNTMFATCLAIALPTFLAGFVLYTFAYMPTGGGFSSAVTAMLRGLFSTGRMFLINDDYGYLMEDPSNQWLVRNVLAQIAFWLCHVLALAVSVSAVFGLVGRRIIRKLQLKLKFFSSVTILCGCGKGAVTLGENIALRDGTLAKPDPNRLVVYLAPEFPEGFEDDIASFGAFGIEYDTRGFLAALKMAGLAAAPWRIGKIRLVFALEDEAETMSRTKQALDCAVACKLGSERFSLFVLSQSVWTRDYVHSLRNTTNKALVDGKYPYTIQATDEAELAARRLMQVQPPHKVLPFREGVAEEDFTVFILGFGSTGCSTLRRLIMNGQFLGSRMHAIVVDRDAELCRGLFEHEYPAMPTVCDVEFHALDVRSSEFFALLDRYKDHLHYIVAALNNDALNLEIGKAVIGHFERLGKPVPTLALAIATGEGEGDELAKRATFYSGVGEIYNEATVLRETTDSMAIAVNTVYSGLSDEEGRAQWYQRTSAFHQESSRASADFVPTMLYIAGVDEDDVRQRDTMTDDMAVAETLSITEHLRWVAFHVAMGYTCMTLDEMRARCEALPEGSRKQCRQDSKRMQHVCMVPWEELDSVTQAYNQLMPHDKRDFKESDREIVTYMPKILRMKASQSDVRGGRRA